MQKVLVFTDLHITKADQFIIGFDPADRFETALRHATNTHPDAAAVILLGDLTHYGSRKEYRRLESVLKACPLPVHMILGNHDHREHALQVFPKTPVTDGFVQSAIDLGAYR